MADRHLAKIDFLRGIAILMVFLFHAQLVLFPRSHDIAYTADGFLRGSTIEKLVRFLPSSFGWSGVQLFLLISGFLIHRNFLKSGENFNPREYFSKRFWRIYPPYIFALLIVILLSGELRTYITSSAGLIDLLQHIFLVHNLSEVNFYSINPALWSLALEMQLYVIYPLFLFLRKCIGIEKAFGISLGLAVLLKIFENLLTGGVYYDSYYFSAGALWYNWCGGALLAEYHLRSASVFKGHAGKIAILALSLFWGSRYFDIHIHLMVITAVCFWAAFMEWYLNNSTEIGKSVIFKLVTALGIYSYSFYLIHQPFILNIYEIFLDQFPMIHWPYYLIPGSILLSICLIVLFFVSKYMYKYVELPSIQWGIRRRNERMTRK